MTLRGGLLAGILIAATALLAISGGVTAQDGGSAAHSVNVANAALTAPAAKAASAAANSNAAVKSPVAAAAKPQDDESLTIEGEKRFHANCGRCHQAPQKFPPRMMATIVRHMRVRATITDDDMRLILRYMTQ